MKILEKYILKENFSPFILSLFIITFLILMNRIIELLNLIIEKQLDIAMIVSIFSLSLPYMLALSVPMAVLVASILSFGRLSVDNELIAFKSCGINIFTLMKPTIIVALLLSIGMIHFNNVILPETNHNLKKLMIKAHYRRPLTDLKTGVFNVVKNITIFLKENDGNLMKGILIYNREEKKFPDTITAEKGEIVLENGGNSLKLTLFNGEMHERDKKDPKLYTMRKFKKFVMNRPDLGYSINEADSEYRSDREMSSAEMKKQIEETQKTITGLDEETNRLTAILSEINADSLRAEREQNTIKRFNNNISINQNKIIEAKRKILAYEVEIQKKYAIAFACLVFVLIGAPVGMMTRTSSVGMAFTVSSLVFMIYYSALIGGEELADIGIVSPFWAMWISNVLFALVGIYLIILSIKETRIFDIQLFLKNLLKIFSKKQKQIFTINNRDLY
ncbi:MAG: LptF/LptG family permease [Candidatus Cloacimonetes bacterium]|nr:LptF/LptG family permease [Candidatus Cloacimonadota bacterium]